LNNSFWLVSLILFILVRLLWLPSFLVLSFVSPVLLFWYVKESKFSWNKIWIIFSLLSPSVFNELNIGKEAIDVYNKLFIFVPSFALTSK